MNYRLAILLLSVLVILAACGRNAEPGIHGVITDGEAGKPLAGASVELLGCTGSDCKEKVASQTTASDGRYDIPPVRSGRYLLSISWMNPPACPNIRDYDTMGKIGDFTVAYMGYGGIGGIGNKRIVAIKELEVNEGAGFNLDLKLACPK